MRGLGCGSETAFAGGGGCSLSFLGRSRIVTLDVKNGKWSVGGTEGRFCFSQQNKFGTCKAAKEGNVPSPHALLGSFPPLWC